MSYRLFSGDNLMFSLWDFPSCMNEIMHFIDATPNNKYLYSLSEVAHQLVSKKEGTLLIGVAPKSKVRPKRGVTIVWDYDDYKDAYDPMHELRG